MNVHKEVMCPDASWLPPTERVYVPPLGRTAVYRCYDAKRRLLYVGMTADPTVRFQGHRRTASWWPLVDPTRTYILWYGSRQAARQAERALILAESPPWNERN